MKCDIIIPVGPGHEELVHRAVGSVEMAKDFHSGAFSDIDVTAVDDTKGLLGRSQARNLAVADSKADWLFFLDADDLMHPGAFAFFEGALFEDMPPDYDAIWGLIVEYKDGVLFERFQVPAGLAVVLLFLSLVVPEARRTTEEGLAQL